MLYDAPLSRRRAFALAWPMIFANATVPLAAVVDTIVIGAAGDKVMLGGVALGGTLFNVFYWSFYFLRMSTTGLVAQARGGNDRAETQRILWRALIIAGVLGAALLVLQRPVLNAGFAILQGDADVEAEGAAYFLARVWGTPGALAMFALTGWLIALGRTGATFAVHAAFSAINVVLDLWFVLGLNLGVGGVGAATAIAEWSGAALGLILVWRAIATSGGPEPGGLDRSAVFDPAAMRALFSVNVNLMVRTWAMILGFSWFVNTGARQDSALLAGNQVLLQFITVWAFVLDAYAFIAEAEVGAAIGKASRARLKRAVRITSELALGSGLAFAVATFVLGPATLGLVIADEDARVEAIRFLPYCAAIPFIGAAAWQLDGIFIGATRGAVLRNAAIAATAIYLALDMALTPAFGPHGMWTAFVLYYVARAVTLGVAYPRLVRSLPD